MKQSRIAILLLLGPAACSAACGLSADGTDGRVVGALHDATAGGRETGTGAYGDDAPGDSAQGDDGTSDSTTGDDAPTDDGALDAAAQGPDAPTGDDGGGMAFDGPADSGTDDSDAALRGDSGQGGPSDAGHPDATVDSGGPTDAGADRQETSLPDAGDAGSCNFNGTWASRLTIDVTWAPQGLNGIILASGSGEIKQWIKGVRVQTGTSTSDATVVCGIALPDFQETAIAGGETYGVRFPNALFDGADGGGGSLPTFTVSAALSGLTAGATYSTTTTAALLGLSMTNPTTDAWPATITTEVDMEHDGKPGVTADTATGSPYSNIPTALPPIFGQPPRANKLYVAIRQVTIVTATVTDCDHMSGTVSIPVIQSKAAIDSHVLGCALADGGDCTTTTALPTQTSQAAFVDNTQPVFTPSGTSDVHSVRLPAGATCADVRAALP